MHASPCVGQKPLHSGALASPHDVDRHSHEVLDVTVPHRALPAHCPTQRPSVKRHWPVARVVLVVDAPGPAGPLVTGPRSAGAQSSCAPLKLTVRRPN